MDPSEPLSTRISANPASTHHQLQSPLFSTLYPELRNLIFEYALTEYDDLTRPYDKDSFYYRPGFEFASKIDTSLLITCRLVYLETHLAPVSLNEHVFWMYRAPPERKHASDCNAYFARLTVQQRGAVKRVRFFAQMFWLEGLRHQQWPEGLAIPRLTITIRHTDWPNWETGAALRMAAPDAKGGDCCGRWVASVPRLCMLELELESIEEKAEQFAERVRVAAGWKFAMSGEYSLVCGEQPARATWMGTASHAAVKRRRQLQSRGTWPLDLKMNVRKLKFVLQFTGSNYRPVYLPPAPSQ
ncbi:hypothetical protein FB45DRAFT_173759 [Roridomyces roridus]|uniref:Uncharacterized protein n=1 Tax=Roridomyces roridus TaxID=1738132 RepID=A0AAD7AX77_9AGAR|nr:hypothetical protein FB45DRAFT_173759 [Roridomyces roridus]